MYNDKNQHGSYPCEANYWDKTQVELLSLILYYGYIEFHFVKMYLYTSQNICYTSIKFIP